MVLSYKEKVFLTCKQRQQNCKPSKYKVFIFHSYMVFNYFNATSMTNWTQISTDLRLYVHFICWDNNNNNNNNNNEHSASQEKMKKKKSRKHSKRKLLVALSGKQKRFEIHVPLEDWSRHCFSDAVGSNAKELHWRIDYLHNENTVFVNYQTCPVPFN